MKLYSINPATEEVLATFDSHSKEEVLERMEELQKGFSLWKKLTLKERKDVIKKIAVDLRENKKEYAQTITREMGKPVVEAIAEVEKCAILCDYFYEHGEEFLSPQKRKGALNHEKESYVVYEPLGIIYAIMPWNFPFWQVFRFGIPSLLAGNVILLKHAPNTSLCALSLENIFRKHAGNISILRAILIAREEQEEMSEFIISRSLIQGVTLTGSVQAGRSVGAIAGKYIKKTVMELGSSDPFIVLEDADLEAAASTAALARCQNSGQSCVAAKRFIIVEKIYDRFMDYFLPHMEHFAKHIGDPLLETTRIGPVARKDLLENLESQVEDTVAKGAKVLMGGKRADFSRGYFYHVTVLENIPESSRGYREELFGPVALVFRVKDLEEAIGVANDTPFGLGASLWTTDYEKARKVIPELYFGNVFINSLVKSDPGFPFGGVKDSGYGRELSLEGIREFVNVKTVRIY